MYAFGEFAVEHTAQTSKIGGERCSPPFLNLLYIGFNGGMFVDGLGSVFISDKHSVNM